MSGEERTMHDEIEQPEDARAMRPHIFGEEDA